MEDAGADDTAIAACKTMGKELMKSANIDAAGGRTPTDAELEGALKEAGEAKAKHLMKDCEGTRDACLTSMTDQVAKAMGKKGEDLKKGDVEKLNADGAVSDVKDAAAACAEAKKDDASATCDDMYDTWLAARGMDKPSDTGTQDRQKKQLNQDAAKDVAKDASKICQDHATEAAVTTCINEFKTSNADTMKEFFPDLSTADLDKRVQTATLEGSRGALGDDYFSCMDAANSDAEKTACKTAMDTDKNKDPSMKNRNVDEVIDMQRGAELAATAKACVGSDAAATTAAQAECRADAKADAISTGMEAKDWGNVQKIGQHEEAAKACAACKLDSTKTDAECEADGKLAFMEVSGAAVGTETDDAWNDIKADIMKLCTAKKEGTPLTLKKKKQMDIDGVTSATTCKDATTNDFNTKLTAKLADNPVGGTTLDTVVKRGGAKGCLVTDGKAMITSAVGTKELTDAQIETLSGTVNPHVANFTLDAGSRLLASFLDADAEPERRLATVTVDSAHAAQGTDLCAEGDTACGAIDSSLTATTASTGSSSTSTTSGVGSTSSALVNTAPTGVSILAMIALLMGSVGF